VLAYDARGQGESTVALNGAAVSIRNPKFSNDPSFWPRLVDDALLVVDDVRRSQDIDESRIVLVGASLGANVSLAAASRHEGLKGVVMLSPGLNYATIRTETLIQDWRRPALIVASNLDGYAAYSARHLKKMAGSDDVTLDILAGGGRNGVHGTQLFDGELEKRILGWIQTAIFPTKTSRGSKGRAAPKGRS
jgi:pimeloyl-ACP methyl ester carboxylesterase